MADIKISALPGASTLTGAETIPLVQGGTTKKVTTDQFLIKDASGNVGLGTASTDARLTVEDAYAVISARSTTGSKRVAMGSDAFTDAFVGSTSAHNLSLIAGGNVGAVLTTSGNLGLGVTPSAWSALSGGKAIQLLSGGLYSFSNFATGLSENSYYANGDKYIVSGVAAAKYLQNAGTHTWATAPSGTAGNPISFTQAMTLDASGNLLVGATSASGKLHVTNTNNVSGDTAGYFALGSNTNNASSYFLQCVTSGVGGKAYILGNGNLQNANNSYGAFSDVKLKENVTDASPKLSKLMQVRIVNYTLKSDPDKAKLIGVVAQELEQVSPGLIEETADFEMVKKTREVTKSVPVTEQVTVQREQKTVEVVDGKAVVTVTLVDEQTAVPVVDQYPLFDADCQPVLEVDTPEVPEVLDEDGNVTQPAVPATYRQAMHSVPRMQDVTETEEYTERVPLGTVTKSVKYSVFVPMLVKAVQEQQTQIESLAARLAALEAKRWTR